MKRLLASIILLFTLFPLVVDATQVVTFVSASNQYVTVADAASLRVEAGSFALGGCVIFNSLPTSGNRMELISKGNAQVGGYGFAVFNNSGTYQINLQSFNTDSMAVNITTPTLGTAYYWFVSYDSSGSGTATFYINAVSQGTASNLGLGFVGTTGVALTIAARTNGAGIDNYSDATMSNWTVYNSTVAGSVVTTNYANTTAPSTTNLVSLWKLDGNYTDSQGSNNGTAVNTPTFSTATPCSSTVASTFQLWPFSLF